ncbi:ribosome small subunit-dependent GTPase A [Alicyclobacillus cycloheptanicus]|uniref:Small ribosomal subunit biogenesis GTPase RsgA n=1 Tax=Alicyclobacillus cycloheptanicus TaxID=1457 RepID=A0ABT9XKN3_9BACL|nr:ribosome small subunit-dependent GTPase A [Alicyclobacillus cycloheptanicus]MDQ0190843.1 ribosome biogenesis GTPase [Alicyclobacillus cycloheptanicus]WDM01458.1 ribosome small subunit-dependent GTPase A [Alicyclobacillus cycloheptanicus]
MPEGVVVRSLAGFFDVSDGDTVRRCRARGVFRKRGVTVLVGDRVTYEPMGAAEGVIQSVLPRTTELIRPPVANVDQALLVFSLVDPDFLPHLLDRMLVVVTAAGLRPAIVITKTDLADAKQVERVMRVYQAAGYDVCPTATKAGAGVDAVRTLLRGRVTVMAGPSGVGKSTLANALDPGLGVKMGEVSEKLGRGKHTTRHVELFKLAEDTYIVDAPGFSQLEIGLAPAEVRDYFPEFAAFAPACPYRGCLHMEEETCAVKDAVARGQIDETRYRSYAAFVQELREKEERRY